MHPILAIDLARERHQRLITEADQWRRCPRLERRRRRLPFDRSKVHGSPPSVARLAT